MGEGWLTFKIVYLIRCNSYVRRCIYELPILKFHLDGPDNRELAKMASYAHKRALLYSPQVSKVFLRQFGAPE